MEKLTKERVKERIIGILILAGKRYIDSDSGPKDPEKAHFYEDELMYCFIGGISEGIYTQDEAKEIATQIRELNEINMIRWYA